MRFLNVIFLLSLAGCIRMETLEHQSAPQDPPIIAIKEITSGGYEKIATIETSRYVMGTVSEINANDTAWSNRALMKEAGKMGADAVILPEISIESCSFSLIPSTRIIAKGTAIRFIAKEP